MVATQRESHCEFRQLEFATHPPHVRRQLAEVLEVKMPYDPGRLARETLPHRLCKWDMFVYV